MKYRVGFSALIASLFVSAPAFAIFEARVTSGLLTSKPALSDLYTSSTSDPGLAFANAGMGFDALVFIPLTGWGFGIRKETLGLSVSGSSLDFTSKADRTAAMVSYRFINTLLHLGVNLTYGLAHSNSMEVTDGSNKLKWEADSSSSMSAGLEAGVGLGMFVLGAEVGTETMKWNKMKDSSSTSTKTPDIDMSGPYAKFYFGFGI